MLALTGSQMNSKLQTQSDVHISEIYKMRLPYVSLICTSLF